MIHKTIN